MIRKNIQTVISDKGNDDMSRELKHLIDARVNEDIKVVFIGGAGECGSRNCTMYVHKNKAFLIDLGMGFVNDPDLPSVHSKLPDLDFIFRHIDMIECLIITHAHNDHIGGVLRFLSMMLRAGKRIDVYCSSVVRNVLINKLKFFTATTDIKNFLTSKNVKTIHSNVPFKILNGNIEIAPVYITHSIPENMSFFISSNLPLK